MGYKRHFDDTEVQELHFKQARQLDFSNRSTQFAGNLSYFCASKKPDAAVDSYSKNEKPLRHEISENAVVPRNHTSEDVSFRVAACSSLSPEYSEYKGLRDYTPFNNSCLPYFDRFPRKQVHIGSNHQASIPLLSADVEKHKKVIESSEPSESLMLTLSNCCDEEKLMGTCIIPMPDTESVAPNCDQLGFSRPDCSCLDAGSLRCVQQHITEARYKLRKSLGHEKFVSLGFNNMGEEVAWRWSEDEERHFRAVIYSNPVSLGRNFWRHLAQVFPTRSMMEIVSYYFNVFVLRKWASRNRSDVLDVDSDDDELHGIDVGPYEGEDSEEEDDSAIQSPVEECGQFNHGEDVVTEDDDDDVDDNNDDGDDNGDGNGGVGNGYHDVKGEDLGADHNSGAPGEKTFNGSTYGMIENYDEDLTIQDDSCTSFEFQTHKGDPGYLIDGEATLQSSVVNSVFANCSMGEVDACSRYMMDMVPMLDFRNDEVLYRLYASPENVLHPIVQDYSCLPLELQADKDEPSHKPFMAAAALQADGVTDAMDLVPMLDFRDDKAWDVIFPGTL
ncbi:AT-rich interactive domain-containing protein 2 [Linum perenne]